MVDQTVTIDTKDSVNSVQLSDKYDLTQGTALMTGIQALVRLPIDRKRLDEKIGINTAGFISGYRGSPLGGYDQQLRAAQKWLDENDIKFWEGLNEDIGATAVWGSQQLGLFPGAKFDGIFGLWYGKAPGVDRTGDAFKHANFAGSSPNGGVLAVIGDDHNCKSSTLPSQSEFAMQDAEIPVLNPHSIQDVLDLGIHGWAISRFAGTWVGLVALADTMDSSTVCNISLNRFKFKTPQFDLPNDGVHLRRGDSPLEKELRMRQIKLPAVQAYVRANRLDKVVLGSEKPKTGIIATGQALQDVFEALSAIGLSSQQASDLGLTIYKVAMPWPLEPEGIKNFCDGLESVLVVEHKRPLIESQLRSALYELPDSKRPLIEGKFDREGHPLLSQVASITIPEIAEAIVNRLPSDWDTSKAKHYFERLQQTGRSALNNTSELVRSPWYCSGCPHNTSTVVPKDSRALAGIGCHYMANFMPERNTDMTSQMGGEGLAWMGQYWATDEPHVFVNLGDGTYSHSGSLAIRAAVTSGANMTYKILYNDAVAMTGGQQVESGQTPVQIAQQIEGEGVETIVIVTEDITRYANAKGLPRRVRIFDRVRMDEVQDILRKTPGVSVMIYDQICATEKRRRTKRGLRKPDNVRVFINQEVCEGCGDCSVKSNCLSVEPVDTLFGRKRRINQSTCNTDVSCVRGFCPSFITVQDSTPAKESRPEIEIDETAIPRPNPLRLDQPYNLIFTGVGGTGVTTVAAVLAMAAHVDGIAATSLDMTGLAQKGGPVISHVRFAKKSSEIFTSRVPPSSADLVIACDLVVAAGADALSMMNSETTTTFVNSDVTPTSEFIQNRSKRFESDVLSGRIRKQVANFGSVNAEALALTYFKDAIYTNMVMLGFAWQNGNVPVSYEALEHAITLNGVKVQDNLMAFNVGRIAANSPEKLLTANSPRGQVEHKTLDELIEHRYQRLVLYQDTAYADLYRDTVDKVRKAEKSASLGENLTRAVATYAYKVMAYKDEYEVARLHSDGQFMQQVRQRFTGGKINFHLAPPLMAAKDRNGHLVKKPFGQWMLVVFKFMAKLKFLRGTKYDIFGWTTERKMERNLRDQYLADIDKLCENLNAKNHALAVLIAHVPDEIRGFGHVKEEAVEKAKLRTDELWNGWPKGKIPHETTTLLKAA